MITPRHGTSFDSGTGASTILPLFSSLVARFKGQNNGNAAEKVRNERQRLRDLGERWRRLF